MVPLCSAGRTVYRGRKPPQSYQPQHDRPWRDSDKPARAATIFTHNGAPKALVGCLKRSYGCDGPRPRLPSPLSRTRKEQGNGVDRHDVQTCIVHLIRNSLDFVSWKNRKPVVAELRKIYRAADAEAGRKALEAFEDGSRGRKYAAIGQIWRRQREQIIPFFAFAPAVRKIV